jgi:phenylpropionate dioxygenase-like ring-hydroxylating dioxygenase large terminal subunit
MTMTTGKPVRVGRSGLVREDREARIFRVHRDALRATGAFEAERAAIFERSWLYLGHISEVPQSGDYFVRTVGGRQVIFCRDEEGELRAWLNTCPHRGTTLCRETEGNARFFRCFYHAWSFSPSGNLVALPGADAYPEDGTFRERLGLRPTGRIAMRSGFVFISHADDGPSLDEHLAGAGDHLDLVAEHSPEGMEVVPGTHQYGVRGNWKLAVENAMDGYHFTPTHLTFVDYLKSSGFVTSDEGGIVQDLGNGHSVMVQSGHSGRVGLDWEPRFGDNEKVRIDAVRAEIASRLGVERARRITDHSRILFVFPNLLIFDIEAVSIRSLEPTSPDTTDVTAWHLAPRNEPPSARDLRLKTLVSFIGPGGLATPDDVEAYEAIQRGVYSTAGDQREGVDWNDISRGMEAEFAGLPGRSIDESSIRGFWRRWDELVGDALGDHR